MNADAPLIISPYCNKSNEEDIYQCLVHTASAVDIPCIIYNIPGRTGCSISAANVERLAAHPNIMRMFAWARAPRWPPVPYAWRTCRPVPW
ncbi:MAG: dihydrodipicolinate synthase family protein [Collinsella sp.]|nr:dihydrodipicolinate synthase family protein [Collinsella sp.]MBS7080403.1 dihydrodipicolinate synthase family protein [Collinsella sp.]